jgi:RimJ/RimL family protein N-acetyltransferase
MIGRRHGITLTRVTEQDIEMIRLKRNAPGVRRYMAYRKYITPSAQREWFRRINNPQNYYFVIHFQDTPCGVINVKEINDKERFGEGGIFIWDESLIGSHVPLAASLLLLDFIFFELDYASKSFVRVLKSNSAAIQFNKQLGYTLVPHQHKSENQVYVLVREDYRVKSERYRRALDLMYPDDKTLAVSGTTGPLHLDAVNAWLKLHGTR